MRKIPIIIICFLCNFAAFSQSDEIKTAKRELKYYKKHLAEYIYFKSECAKKDSSLNEQDELVAKLTSDVNQLNTKLLAKLEQKTEVKDTRIMPTGTSYQIQIGVYKNTELMQYLEEPKYLGYELDKQLIRYHIGYFQDYIEAKKFLDVIKRMGISDAFISEYLDGKKVKHSSNVNYNTPINKTYSENKTSTISPNKTVNTSSNTNNVKLQNNWAIEKDADGNEVIVIKPKEPKVAAASSNTNAENNKDVVKATSTTTSKPAINTSDEKLKLQNNWVIEKDEDGNEIIRVKTKETSSISPVNSNNSLKNESNQNEVIPTKPPINATNTSNTSTNVKATNSDVKLEKNWQMTTDEDGNQIIKIVPKN